MAAELAESAEHRLPSRFTAEDAELREHATGSLRELRIGLDLEALRILRSLRALR